MASIVPDFWRMPRKVGDAIRYVQTRPFIVNVYAKYRINKEEKRIDSILLNKKWDNIKFYDHASLLQKLKEGIRNDTCHIVASGWSTLDSIDKISVGLDYVFGFNFCAVLNLNFDAYFIEIATMRSAKTLDLSRAQAELVKNSAKNRISQIYIKNTWSEIDPSFIWENYGSSLPVLYDIHYPVEPDFDTENGRKQLIDNLVSIREKYLIQYGSTTITCIALAYQLGFKKIVVHGLDFGGSHFFSEGNFDISTNTLAVLQKYHPPLTNNIQHPTATGVMKLLPALASFMKKNDVCLYTGSERSPSAKLLPVYENQGLKT